MRQHSGALAPKRSKRMTRRTFPPEAAKSSSGPRDYIGESSKWLMYWQCRSGLPAYSAACNTKLSSQSRKAGVIKICTPRKYGHPGVTIFT